MNTNITVISLTRLGIKPKSTTLETDAPTNRPSELLNGSGIEPQTSCTDVLITTEVNGKIITVTITFNFTAVVADFVLRENYQKAV